MNLLLSLVVCCLGMGCAQEQGTAPPAQLLSVAATEDDFPTLGRTAEGELCAAWVSFDDKADTILCRRLQQGTWTPAETVSPKPGDYHTPRVAADGQGRTWIVWPANENGRWNLVGRYRESGRWSPLVQLTNAPTNNFNVRLATAPDGTVWAAWQAVANDNFEVYLARLTPSGLADPMNLSEHPASDWEPALCVGPNGTVFVAWDTYRNGSYDIYLREVREGKLSPPAPIAATNRYEAHAAVTCDAQDRCWVAWDEANPNWGRTSRPSVKLHQQRRLGMRVWAGGRQWNVPDPVASLPAELQPFCELPDLGFDGAGNLWLLFRHLNDVNREARLAARAAKKRPVQTRGIWNFYAMRLGATGWTASFQLPDSNGRNDQRVALATDSAGRLWAAYADDGRRPERAEEWVNHNVRAMSFSAAVAGLPKLVEHQPLPPFVRPPEPRHNRKLTVAGMTCELLFGDTHRHTDLSRCAMNYDGSLIDTYRYALDCAQLDFLAISDHDQDLLRHRYGRQPRPLNNYGWWRSQKYADLFTVSDRFLALYGYEHGGSYASRGGHKNVVYATRGKPCIEDDAPKDLFRLLKGTEAVAIPHQLADGGSRTDWDQWNSTYERVAEIFQARGSYEYQNAPRPARVQTPGFFLWDAYAKGVKVGILASSDHGLTHGAYAGVYSTSRTRKAILEALEARRTYGSTETIEVDFRCGDHWMGQELPSASAPRFHVSVRGVKPLKEVALVKNGKFIFHQSPNRPELAFEFADPEPVADTAYYYVRVIQTDDEIAWSSPIWFGAEK